MEIPENCQHIKQDKEVKTGLQTKITESIKNAAGLLKKEGDEMLIEMIELFGTGKIIFPDESSELDFSKTADDILKKDTINGCHEAATLATAILRAKGVPVTYIQTLEREALENFPEKKNLRGHVFLEIYDNDEKKIFNPMTGQITKKIPDKYIEGVRGLDSWDCQLIDGTKDLNRLFNKKYKEIYEDKM